MAHQRERDRCLRELGLQEPASEEDIKKAYKAAAFKYHPDKNPDNNTTSKFQQVHAAYKFLTEGNDYLTQAREDAHEFSILRFLFPWLFGSRSFTNSNHQSFFRTSNVYYDDDSSEEEDYFYEYYYEPQGQSTRGSAYTMPGSAYTAPGANTRGGAYTTRGANARGGANTARGANARGGAFTTPAANTRGGEYTGYGATNKNSYTSHGAATTGGPSGTSEHFTRNTNFTHTSTQHGQFFQETQSKGKAAKKRNRDAKRAAKLAADKERSESASKTTLNRDPQTKPARAKSPTPDRSQNQPIHKEDKPQTRQAKESSQSPRTSRETSSSDNSKDHEEHTNKKSKKQIEMQREKELKEITEELHRQEKERKEKLEKKRAIQEEKERQEREAREKEEQRKAEEERQRAEELRKLQEMKDEERKQKKREADKKKKLFDEFDSATFIDEKGDFKYTDPEMKKIIHRDDVNHLGNARQNKSNKKFEEINGLTTEHLIKLQDGQSAQGQPRSHKENVQASANHSKLGPVGSRPQNVPMGHSGQQSNNHHQREFHPRHQQPPPQQMYSHQQPPIRQQAAQVPFWSSTQPPPPLHSVNTNVPRVSGWFNQGHAPNKNYRAGARVFTHQNFQGQI